MNRVKNFFPRLFNRLLKSYDAEEHVAGEFRAEQIRAVLKFTPLAILANLFNVSVICWTFRHHPKLPLLFIWALIIAICVVGWIGAWRTFRRGHIHRSVSSRAIRRATHNAAILAIVWGALPVLMFSGGDDHTQLIVTVITTGMICAGGFALAMVPSAGLIYVLILTLGSFIGIVLDGIGKHFDLVALLFTYSLIVCGSVVSSARTFGARMMAEAKAAHQQQVVGLLLNDFESHASDWLWEIDDQGYLKPMSARVMEFFELTRATLRQKKFIDYFGFAHDDIDSHENMKVEKLRERLAHQTPFRDLWVPVVVKGERRWWSMTAKPLIDGRGKITGWRGVGSDVTQQRHADNEMHRLANVDSLTGLANRHQFRKQLLQLAQVGDTLRPACALFYLDLDNFKYINDSLGHGGGDRVLQMVATRLSQRVRREDLLARLGGDEFALISYNPDPEPIAQRLLEAFHAPFLVDGVNLQVSSSIGIALSPTYGGDPDALLKNADMALYAAKSSGRGSFRFFDENMGTHVQERLSMLNELHEIVKRLDDEAKSSAQPFPFKLYFQPQLRLNNLQVVGMEALLRWDHNTRGKVSPTTFIPLLEESGLIVPLGAWVLREACRQAMTWHDQQTVAVNVSAVQFAHGSVVEAVGDALRETGLAPHRLELEITESLLMQDSSNAGEALKQLRKLGVRIALDDFGTGYSSLAYLGRYEFDKLKIEQSFISSLGEVPSAHAIVRAIIALANALNLETTAEGIETAQQAETLRQIGCMNAQGYYFGVPMPAEEVATFFHVLT